MGIIMLTMGKIKLVQIIFYLVAAVVLIVYTPLLLKYRSKKQVKEIEGYHVPNEMTFNDEGIQVEFADKKETYEWEQIQKVVTTPKTIGFYYETEKALIVPKPDFGDKFVPILTLATKKIGPVIALSAPNGVNQLVQDAIRNQQSRQYDQCSGESPG